MKRWSSHVSRMGLANDGKNATKGKSTTSTRAHAGVGARAVVPAGSGSFGGSTCSGADVSSVGAGAPGFFFRAVLGRAMSLEGDRVADHHLRPVERRKGDRARRVAEAVAALAAREARGAREVDGGDVSRARDPEPERQ